MQHRPTQRANTETARWWLFHQPTSIRAFQKREAYGKFTEPRNIATVNADHRLRLSCFTYAFAEAVLKPQPWYAFGKHPREFSQRLRDHCALFNQLLNSDVSRLDGSTGLFHSDTYHQAMLRFFAPCWHEELKRLLEAEINTPAVTAHGLRYKNGTRTITGSPSTTGRNTLVCTCLVYIALRLAGDDDHAAWFSLGTFGGDDSSQGGLGAKTLETVFQKTGLSLKVSEIQRNQPVPFLGRYYIDPWTTTQSICDVARQIRKLHLTCASEEISDEIVLRRRAMAFRNTDPHTPLVGPWSRAVLRILGPLTAKELDHYHKTAYKDVPWWDQYDQPFDPPSDLSVAYDIVAKDLGVTTSTLTDWESKCDSADSLQQLFDLPCLEERIWASPAPIVAAGTMVGNAANRPAFKTDFRPQTKSLAPRGPSKRT